jgi:hypothetical protein
LREMGGRAELPTGLVLALHQLLARFSSRHQPIGAAQ